MVIAGRSTLEQYFIANDIVDNAKKKGILLRVIGNEAYRLLSRTYETI